MDRLSVGEGNSVTIASAGVGGTTVDAPVAFVAEADGFGGAPSAAELLARPPRTVAHDPPTGSLDQEGVAYSLGCVAMDCGWAFMVGD
jgi:hypothetical protein